MTQNVETSADLPHTGYLRLPQILRLIPIGRSTWWRWVAEGKAPKPVKLGPKTTAWTATSIRQLISDLESE